MSRLFLHTACAAVIGFSMSTPMVAAQAANASAPYKNVDHRVDAGNDTGDSQVEQLNAAQLGKNQPTPGATMPIAPDAVPQGTMPPPAH